tara:strand:+ start:3097 stop:3318 length:222 start_codon:yes stop_codon:yes gene_type:complete
MKNDEERKEWHKKKKIDEYDKRKIYVEDCKKKGLVYQTAFELMFGNYENKTSKARVFYTARQNSATLNGKKMY